MSDILELIRRYEPVLRFSTDGQGRRESFFPLAASDYVHQCGLRRRGVGWLQPPGEALLRHLESLDQPGECYLSFAAGDLEGHDEAGRDVVLALVDQGLELSRQPPPGVQPSTGGQPQPGAPPGGLPGFGDPGSWTLEGAPAGQPSPSAAGPVMPRMLVNAETADDLERYLAFWGGVERQPLTPAEEDPLLQGAPAADLEWFIPRGFSGLPDKIRRQALSKYEPYRDWEKHPPVYHYHINEDRGYRVLQYWFLYAYNDWAAHGGHNDHEGDWEVIFVFLDGKDHPQHVAYSRHVRIPWIYEPSKARWTDVERVRWSGRQATHPVVYVGCGSHASYLEQDVHRIMWLEDFAKGDDVSIGPGGDQRWGQPIQLASKRWNEHFSGHWGSLVKTWLGIVAPGSEGPTSPAQKGSKWERPAKWASVKRPGPVATSVTPQERQEERTVNSFEKLLQKTEGRFKERTEERTTALSFIEEGNILMADREGRVERRLERLGVDRVTAETILEGGLAFDTLATLGVSGETDPVVLERVIQANDLMSINFLEMGLLTARTVGRVHVFDTSGHQAGFGTGFMVSPNLLMTNNHVLTSAQTAAVSQVEFNYQIGIDGRPMPSVFFRFRPDEFFLTDPHLDYSLVAVQPRRADGQEVQAFGWNRLIEDKGKAIKGEFLNIVQHPDGKPKQLVLRDNQLIDILDDFLHYRADTRPGSSGSPAFNDLWEIVALHHSGVPERDEEGNILTIDGKRWHAWMGEQKISWLANEGARISRIVHHIKRQQLSATQARLRSEMFELEPPRSMAGLAGLVTPPAGGERGAAGIGTPSVSLAADGTATWNIPLQVTVRVGDAGLEPGSEPDLPPEEEQPTDREMEEALAELDAAREREYYDAQADLEARNAYYAGLELSDDAAEAFAEVSKLLKDTHIERPRYSPRRHVYPWVDLQPDLKLRSIYSDLVFDPEEFIREDFGISRERALRVQELILTESTRKIEDLEAEIDLLEAQLPYNCEHVVPQSWFRKREPMRGDLHHLFACESRCNSFRGNRAYFDFPDFEEAMRDDCGKLMENRFEPEAGKGAIARAALYFLLRYPGEIDDDQGEFDLDRLPLLVDWHKGHPVTEYEKHRNLAIFEKQGNRNPLIDFPEWIDVLDFRLGFG